MEKDFRQLPFPQSKIKEKSPTGCSRVASAAEKLWEDEKFIFSTVLQGEIMEKGNDLKTVAYKSC